MRPTQYPQSSQQLGAQPPAPTAAMSQLKIESGVSNEPPTPSPDECPLSPTSSRHWSSNRPHGSMRSECAGASQGAAATINIGWTLDEIARECAYVACPGASSSAATVHSAPSNLSVAAIPQKRTHEQAGPSRSARPEPSQAQRREEAKAASFVPAVRTRSCKERVAWSGSEDAVIRAVVAEQGHRWAQIANQLPGRTHAAVRNRWSRLQEEDRLRAELLQAPDPRQLSAGSSSNFPASSSSASYSGSVCGWAEAGTSAEAKEEERGMKWREEEDSLIMDSVHDVGRRWSKISAMLPGRSEQAVRNRYYRLKLHSTSNTSQGNWAPEEDEIIMASVAELGKKWILIAQRLPNRTEDAIRHRYSRLYRAVNKAQQEASHQP
uniref:Uncharacterized protein n=1 Tax=Chrysotila carterae TaxID=13221 RepID=A0A7S4C0F3_CHRCT|mmetsp:Transcript_13485/g.26271  ORF Transcript_13485/g.26271 Transcript_13485/m.26271 type:complete len:380 (-) Transcript_13485:427-1566(-)